MRVAIDARMDRAGIGRYTQSLVAALAEVDPETEYVVLLRRGKFDEYEAPAPNVVPQLADIEWYSLAEQTRLPSLLWRGRFDLVHFPHFNVPLRAPKPYVVTIHDLTHLTHSTARPSAAGRVAFAAKRVPYRLVVSRAARSASHVLTVSEYTRSVIESRLGIPRARITVAYEAAGDAPSVTTAAGGRDGAPYFLSVGNAFPYKNLPRLIEAFARFRDVYGSSHVLVLAGEQRAFAAHLMEVAARCGVSDSVEFVGAVTDEELARLYADATALAFVSMSEGFGLPGLEAMRHGTPVIAARGTALPEIYGDAALYVDPHSVDDIAGALGRIAQDGALALTLGERGLARAAEFSWRETAERTIDVYRRALGSASATATATTRRTLA